MEGTNIATFKDNGKRFAKNIKLYILIIFVVLVYKVYGTVSTTLDDMWREVGSPYPIKTEFLVNATLANGRAKLEKLGFDKDGFLLKSLQRLHHYFYQEALKVIPEDDSFRIAFLYYYELKPIISRADLQELLIEWPRMIKVLEILTNGNSKVEDMQEVMRFAYATSIFEYLLSGNDHIFECLLAEKEDDDLLITYRKLAPQALLYANKLFAESGDIKVFLATQDAQLIPLWLTYSTLGINTIYIHLNPPVKCESEAVNKAVLLTHLLKAYLEQYNSVAIAGYKEKEYRHIKNRIEELLPEMEKWYEYYCDKKLFND